MSPLNTIIAPTVGRRVWFHPVEGVEVRGPGAMVILDREQPLDAGIVFVWGDRLVNLDVTDHEGRHHALTSVPLAQPGDSKPTNGIWCEWMPFQKGQAKAQVETMYSALQAASSTAPLPEQEANKAAEGEAYLAFAHEKGILPFDFGAALKYLKHGRRVARAGWNGKGMFVYMVPAASYPAQTGAAKAYFGEGSMVPYNAYFALKGVDGAISTWVPSINDSLAEDWVLLS